MKGILLILCLALSPLSIKSQGLFIKSGSKHLYQGIANPLRFTSDSLSYDYLAFTSTNGDKDFYSTGIVVYPTEIGLWKMYIYQVNSVDSILKDSLVLEVKKIPDPIPSIYMRREGTFSKNAIAAANMESSIHSSEILACGLRFPILSYHIVAFRNQEILWEVTNEGARITDSNQELILTLESGDLISFTNILGLNAYDEENELTPFQVEIQ